MRRAVHRRQFHRLADRGRRLRGHGLSVRGHSRGRQLRGRQARGHRRRRDRGHGRRADALRDRRPARLPAAGRALRLHRRHADPGRPGPGAGAGRGRRHAAGHLQGLRHHAARQPHHLDLPHGRTRCRRQGRARVAGADRQVRAAVRREGLGPVQRDLGGAARRRGHVRPARPRRRAGDARGGGEDRRQAQGEGRAGVVLQGAGAGRDRHGAGPDRLFRRPPERAAGGAAVVLQGAQARCRRHRRFRRQAHRRGDLRRLALGPGGAAGAAGRRDLDADRRRRERAADPAGGGAQRRQGRPRQRRRHGARPGLPAVHPRRAERAAGGGVLRPPDRGQWLGVALGAAGQPQFQFPHPPCAGRRRHRLAAHRPAGQVLRADAAGHRYSGAGGGGRGAARDPGAGRDLPRQPRGHAGRRGGAARGREQGAGHRRPRPRQVPQARPDAAARARAPADRPRLALPRAVDPVRLQDARRQGRLAGRRQHHRRHRLRGGRALPDRGQQLRHQGRHHDPVRRAEDAAPAGDRAAAEAAGGVHDRVRRRQPDVPGRAVHSRRQDLRQPGAAVGGRHSPGHHRARFLDRRRRLHAGPVRLRDHGAQERQGLPRRSAAAQGRHRRDRGGRGPGRRRNAHPAGRHRRVPGRERRRRHPHRARGGARAELERRPPRGGAPAGARAALRHRRDLRRRARRLPQALRLPRGHHAAGGRLRVHRVQGRVRQADRLRPRRDRRPPGRHHQQQRPHHHRRRDQGRPVHPALLPRQPAHHLPHEHHRLHGRLGVGAGRHRQARLEDDPGRGQRHRAADHAGHGRQLRRRQLRHVRARLRAALHLRLAEQPHRGHGRRAGGQGDVDHHAREVDQGRPRDRRTGRGHPADAGNADRQQVRRGFSPVRRISPPVRRRPDRPA
ncbi:UNVERIFIED_CONTAM: hypothetical protein NCL1_05854 [Trichonephila clavipes]